VFGCAGISGRFQPEYALWKYGDIEVVFIGKDDLVKNKKSTNRAKDKVDVEELL
jgi:hypothetical protein